MTPAGFDFAWTKRQTSLLQKVEQFTVDTELQDLDMKKLLLLTAREPSKAHIFNHASMAHNNHFYFSGLSPTPDMPVPPFLKKELEAAFSSIETLRREFIFTAAAMFGPGFIWLVKYDFCRYRILPTYIAGSPYPGAHWRRQPVDLNNAPPITEGMSYFNYDQDASKANVSNRPPGGVELEPLLCLNTWEQAWAYDFGYELDGHGGKINFTQAWWRYIDWEKVQSRAKMTQGDFKGA
ncbi:hypothetical protein CDD80_1435 [Ophiocordyceps camponoti-rufipedis]|uniref:Manganese/iron superoxide dismutase C-terminal domain-containing protein n=1 Tax=Ophiocordyceps camponoti-rufipedis TaxID=2004952 RepID=A0A2C5X8V2_9HYPO|nr:hypothetical protein CDD80_1435 [Ophiocordyceps camponoti-rufipedis]